MLAASLAHKNGFSTDGNKQNIPPLMCCLLALAFVGSVCHELRGKLTRKLTKLAPKLISGLWVLQKDREQKTKKGSWASLKNFACNKTGAFHLCLIIQRAKENESHTHNSQEPCMVTFPSGTNAECSGAGAVTAPVFSCHVWFQRSNRCLLVQREASTVHHTVLTLGYMLP